VTASTLAGTKATGARWFSCQKQGGTKLGIDPNMCNNETHLPTHQVVLNQNKQSISQLPHRHGLAILLKLFERSAGPLDECIANLFCRLAKMLPNNLRMCKIPQFLLYSTSFHSYYMITKILQIEEQDSDL